MYTTRFTHVTPATAATPAARAARQILRALALALVLGGTLARSAQAQKAVDVSGAWTQEGGQRALAVRFTIPEGYYLYADRIHVAAADGITLKPLVTPAAKEKQDPFEEKVVQVYDHDTTFVYAVEPAGVEAAPLTVGFQACSPELCYLPATRKFTVAGAATAQTAAAPAAAPAPEAAAAAGRATPASPWHELIQSFHVSANAAGYLKPEAFLAFLDGATHGAGAAEPSAIELFRQRGVWLSCLLILLWGLALNLTPCVLPMIPVNLAIIGAGVEAGSRRRGLLLGGAYGLGIALVYGLLGLVVVLTGARFGALNASPWFNLGIGIVFALLALGMFGLFNIDLSRFQGRLGGDAARRGRMLTALMMGGVAALLAGACVAPVVIWVLLLSTDLYTRGVLAGLLLPFLLGVGMALPWPLAGAGLSVLPKPGRWMERIKIGFGIIILAAAVWYGAQGVNLLRTRAASAAPAAGAGAPASDAPVEPGWHVSLDSALAEAAREQKPVFIDFWASWCKNCKHMDKTTFKDAAVKQRLEAFVKVKFRAEDLQTPEVRDELDFFDVIGLPTYVVLVPNATNAPAP